VSDGPGRSASMGPSIVIDGDVSRLRDGGGTTGGFNGAVDRDRRRQRAGAAAVADLEASMGPSIVIDGDVCRRAALEARGVASMGPSIVIDGDLETTLGS